MTAPSNMTNELLATMLATVPASIAVFDVATERVILANARYRSILDSQWHDRDLVGVRIADILRDPETTLALIRSVAQTGEPWRTAGFAYDGFERGVTYWDFDLTPMWDEAGRCISVMLAAVDVTEHMRAQLEMQTLAAVSTAVTMSLDLDDVLDRILVATAPLIPYDRAFVLLDAGETLRIAAGRDGTGRGNFLRDTLIPKGESINGWVFAHGEPQAIGDVYESESGVPGAYHPDDHDPLFRSVLCVPLIVRERVIGTMHVASYNPHRYSADDLRRVLLIAPHAAAAINNAMLYHDATERATELVTLNDATMAIASTLGLEEVLERILIEIERVVPYDRAVVALPDTTDPAYLQVVSLRTTSITGHASPRVPIAGSIIGRVFTDAIPVLVPNLAASPEWKATNYDPHGVWGEQPRSILALPLRAQEETVGVLYLTQRGANAYGEHDRDRLLRFSPAVAMAVTNARLYAQQTTQLLQLGRANNELETLREIGIAATSTLDLPEVLNRTMTQISRVVPYEHGLILLDNPARTMLRIEAAVGAAVEEHLGMEMLVTQGLAGWAYRHAETICIADLHEQQEWAARAHIFSLGAGSVTSVICAPLLLGGQPIGTINLMHHEVGKYTPDDVRRVERYATQVAVAVGNARLYSRSTAQVTQLEQANAQLETLREVGIASTSTLELKEVLQRVLAQISRVVPYEQGQIALEIPEKPGMLRVEVGRGIATEPYIGREVSADSGVGGWVYTHGETVVIRNLLEEEEWSRRAIIFGPLVNVFVSILCVPLRVGGRVIGVIHLVHRIPEMYGAEEARRIEQLATQVAAAVVNARLYAQVQRQVGELRSLNSDMETLNEIGRTVSESLDLQIVMPRVLAGVIRIIPAEYAYITLMEPDGEFLRIVCEMGMYGKQMGMRIPLDGSINGAIARTQQPVLVGDVDTDPDWGDKWYPADDSHVSGMRNVLGGAMVVAGESIGTLYLVHSTPHIFTEHDRRRVQQYAAQVAVAVANARLYDRIHAQVEDLRRLNEELASISQHKSEFLATMSHELRTPLNAIIGFTQLLQDDLVTDAEERRMCLEDVSASATHLLRLINDVLDVAKIEAGQMELHREHFRVGEEIAEAERLMAPLINRSRQTLTVVPVVGVPPVFADRARFRQVLLNVFSNANKFTPEGGAITVVTDLEGDFVRVAITDTGIGIHPDDAHKVFEEFRQIDSALNRRYSGTGLGLSLSRRLIETLGGTIRFESTPGVGTTFYVTLPTAVRPGSLVP